MAEEEGKRKNEEARKNENKAFINKEGKRVERRVGDGENKRKLYHVQVQISYSECCHYVYLRCTNKFN